jgi:putative endonuclease
LRFRVVLAMSGHHVYLALTSDGAYYCGYATDPEARIAVHNAGRGAKILRGKLPVVLTYVRRFSSKSAALKFEFSLKGRTHAYKRTLARRWHSRH